MSRVHETLIRTNPLCEEDTAMTHTHTLVTLTDLVAAVRHAVDVRTGCVVGVLSGVEHEELFDDALNPIGMRDNPAGEVSGFAPPGDIHRIRNISHETAISLHIFGTDISRVGSSARRFYN